MASTLKIFDILKELANKNYGFYDSLSEEDKKSISPYVLYQWLSTSTKNLPKFNNINKYIFELQEHKDLLWKLLCAVSGKNRCSWIKMPTTSMKKSKFSDLFQNLNEDELKIVEKNINTDERKCFEEFLKY